MILLNLVYDINHEVCHNFELVSDIHITYILFKSVYFGGICICGIWILLFISEINGMKIWTTYIVNTCLEAETLEKFYIIYGAEFGDSKSKFLLFPNSYMVFVFCTSME